MTDSPLYSESWILGTILYGSVSRLADNMVSEPNLVG